MEMQLQQFHSAKMSSTGSAAAGHEAHHLISSMSSSSSPSSSLIRSASHNNISSSPSIANSPQIPCAPPPAADPQQPQAVLQHSSIAIQLPSAPTIPTTRRLPPCPTKEEAWKSLRESIPHSMELSKLLKSERGYQKEANSHKKLMRRHSKDLYIVVSIYALLQGALFTAVAQSSIFTCADWWGPVGIVVSVTIGTVFSALDKLRSMGYERQEAKRSERCQSAVYDKIAMLYYRGSLCEIESLEPACEGVLNNEAGSRCVFSVHGLLVLGFLLGFSALMMVSCTRMLTCNPCHCHN